MLFILLTQRIIRHAREGLGILALLLLTGCSTLQLAYNNSDEVLYWWVNSHLDLNDGQKPLVRQSLKTLHQWHRQNQLPLYVTQLQRMQALAPKEVTASQVCAVTQTLQTSFVQLLYQIEPASSQLGMSLKPEQLSNLRQRYDKANAEWREDWLTPTAPERLKRRYKLSLNRLEDLYGKLETTQREALQQWLSQSTFDPELSYAERERRQADSLQTLQRMIQSKDAAQSEVLLRAWLDRSLNPPDERVRLYVQSLWQNNCEGFAKFHNSTTAAQRERLARTLGHYESELRGLMADKR